MNTLTSTSFAGNPEDKSCKSENSNNSNIIWDSADQNSIYLGSVSDENHYKITSTNQSQGVTVAVYCPLTSHSNNCTEDQYSENKPGILTITELPNRTIKVFTQFEDKNDEGGGLQYQYKAICTP